MPDKQALIKCNLALSSVDVAFKHANCKTLYILWKKTWTRGSKASTSPLYKRLNICHLLINRLNNSLKNVNTPKPTSSLKLIPRPVCKSMQTPIYRIPVRTHRLKAQTVFKAQTAADQTSNDPLWHPPTSTCVGQSLLSPSKLILDQRALPLIVSGKESRVLTERMEMANTSGSRLAHVPHLPFILGLPAWQIWRGIEVALKWDGGKLRSLCRHTEWLNAGIRGTAANIKTERETYPSGAINEGEIRCVVSVRVCVCVW